MKNGRALKRHRRIRRQEGAVESGRTRRSAGGCQTACICGWEGSKGLSKRDADRSYRAHLDHQIDTCPIRCKRCGEMKSVREMRPDHRYVCLPCFSKIGNEWQKAHPAEAARHRRNHHLLNKFGLTIEEAERMLAVQGNRCAICRSEINDSRGHSPHVDHDHESGKVRGILCFGCNSGLGSFKDDVTRLKAAVAYLESHKQQGSDHENDSCHFAVAALE